LLPPHALSDCGHQPSQQMASEYLPQAQLLPVQLPPPPRPTLPARVASLPPPTIHPPLPAEGADADAISAFCTAHFGTDARRKHLPKPPPPKPPLKPQLPPKSCSVPTTSVSAQGGVLLGGAREVAATLGARHAQALPHVTSAAPAALHATLYDALHAPYAQPPYAQAQMAGVHSAPLSAPAPHAHMQQGRMLPSAQPAPAPAPYHYPEQVIEELD